MWVPGSQVFSEEDQQDQSWALSNVRSTKWSSPKSRSCWSHPRARPATEETLVSICRVEITKTQTLSGVFLNAPVVGFPLLHTWGPSEWHPNAAACFVDVAYQWRVLWRAGSLQGHPAVAGKEGGPEEPGSSQQGSRAQHSGPSWRFRGVPICHMSISFGLISNPIHSKEMLHWGLGLSQGGREWNALSPFTLYQALGTRCAPCPI